MKKVVINKCYGGFGLSPLAMKELAKLEGKKCYFFVEDSLVNINDCDNSSFWSAYSIKDPDFEKMSTQDEDGLYTTANQYSDSISIVEPNDRSCPNLVKVVEKLGADVNGAFADLKIIEIPQDVEYTIEEYDGIEWVAEVHKTWG